MVRVNKQTYADYVVVDLEQYEKIHGLIEAFGGRVKQFTQDLKHLDDWIIFFEMSKLQKVDFDQELIDSGFVVENPTPK